MSHEQLLAIVREDTALLADWAEEPTAMSSVDADKCRERVVHAAEAMAECLLRAREAMDEVDRMFVFGWRRNDVPQRSKEVIERWDVARTTVGCKR